MLSYLIQRLGILAATVALASIVVFGAIEILPGDAAQVMLGTSATPDAVAALAHKLGLDQNLAARYLSWIGGALRGDLGLSYAYDSPIGPLIAERMAVSAPLAALAMLIAATISLGAGLFAARNRGRPADFLVMAASQAGLAIPYFWFGILLILAFAVHWRLFPSGGFPGWSAGPGRALLALVLPAIALGGAQAAILTRVTRSAVLEVLGEDFIRTARAKGLSQRATLWRHALPNALAPILTIMGLQFANLIAGAIVIENVFSLPGVGRLIFQSIANRDLLVIEDCVMLLAIIVIAVNFFIDIACATIDPRLRARAT